ncbi:MAG: hypothetical protein K8R36_04755 [Planctomycetales bacterium]|nr:hypothetical protein [Planctomycetales bacterium]
MFFVTAAPTLPAREGTRGLLFSATDGLAPAGAQFGNQNADEASVPSHSPAFQSVIGP